MRAVGLRKSNSYTIGMELYHLLNRGVEKRNIFLDNQDRSRFVSNLSLFNDRRPVDNIHRIFNGTYVGLTKSNKDKKRIVRVYGWCLMKNHYHLLLSEATEGGITQFIRKLNIGYSKYFNERYKRSGALFQGRTKKVAILKNSHFMHILHYIHLNPLDYLQGARDWRSGRVANARNALAYLESYRWSSYIDYAGQSNFPDLLTSTLFEDTPGDYSKTLRKYLEDIETSETNSLALE